MLNKELLLAGANAKKLGVGELTLSGYSDSANDTTKVECVFQDGSTKTFSKNVSTTATIKEASPIVRIKLTTSYIFTDLPVEYKNLENLRKAFATITGLGTPIFEAKDPYAYVQSAGINILIAY